MKPTTKTIITRSETSIRLIEAAHHMFSKNIDDLALLTVVGAVHTAAYEELKLDETEGDANQVLRGMFSKQDKQTVDIWFNFLKHGSRGPRSLGDEMDISALVDEEKDLLLFGNLWKATIVHVAAYEKRTELIDIILTLGQATFVDDEEVYDPPDDKDFFGKNIRWVCDQWYSREDRARENNVDSKKAHQELDGMLCSPLESLLSTVPKQPVRNRQQRRQERKNRKKSN